VNPHRPPIPLRALSGEFTDELGGSPLGEFNFSFGAFENDELLIAALKGSG